MKIILTAPKLRAGQSMSTNIWHSTWEVLPRSNGLGILHMNSSILSYPFVGGGGYRSILFSSRYGSITEWASIWNK